MVALNDRGSCRDAEPYYYEFLLDPDDPNVPDSIANHISGCAHCRREMRRLEGAVAAADASADRANASRQNAGSIDLLGLHFEYLDEYVTCAQVKPFLPALAAPSAQIRIPTPITVHVDHCAQCAQDVETIKNLKLDAGQLARLSRLYGETPKVDLALCRRAAAFVGVLGSGSPAGIEADLLEHLCVCPQCRARVYEYRQNLLRGQPSVPSDSEDRGADNSSMADVFDCVVPLGRAGGEPASSRSPAPPASRAGLEKMQALHEALYDIAERADSGTVTVYTTVAEDGRTAADADDRYAAHGVNVRVIQRAPAPAAQGRAVLKRYTVRAAIKPFVRVAAAVALVPLVLVLLVHTRSASGTGPDEIIDAFARAANVHVRLFYPGREEIVWELWASREPDLLMTTGNDACALYDMSAKTKCQTSPATGAIETVPLDEREYEGARRIMEHSLGFTLNGIPMNRQWELLTHDDANAVDVYALTWTAETSSGRAYLVRWQVDVDSRLELPTRTRLYQKYSSEDGWELQSQRSLEYPTKYEIRAAIAERFPAEAAAPI